MPEWAVHAQLTISYELFLALATTLTLPNIATAS